jgi:hypothetical protein
MGIWEYGNRGMGEWEQNLSRELGNGNINISRPKK